MDPGTVRAISYEIVSLTQAGEFGLSIDQFRREFLEAREIGVMRVVDHHGAKFTLLGPALSLQHLIATGRASDPAGMVPKRKDFPVVVAGWKQAATKPITPAVRVRGRRLAS